MDDYGGKFPPTNYSAYNLDVSNPDPKDRTWVQLVSTYSNGGMDIFECPGDTGRGSGAHVSINDDVDTSPSDDWDSFYMRSLRTNMGFNYVYLSPIVRTDDGGWVPMPGKLDQLAYPAGTLTHVDSIWTRDKASGQPLGGGRWVVVPPCRLTAAGASTFSENGMYLDPASHGWDDSSYSSRSGAFYGGAWPWHSGRFTVIFADLHVRTLTEGQLTAGCDVKRNWKGVILDPTAYLWDRAQ